MKTKLLLIIFLFSSVFSFSQVIWTGGGGDPDWNNANNWSSNMVPTLMDDVEIDSGFTVTIDGGAVCESLELKGTAILNIDGSFTSAQPSLFEAGTTINWAGGSINCSLLVNQGTINLTSNTDKSIETSTLVNNNGTINIIGSGNLFLRSGTVLNNQIDGTIIMGADDSDIDALDGLPIINNAGIMRRSTSTGEAEIASVEFNNNGGIIQVDTGSLSINGVGDKNFAGGTYIVSAGAILDLDTTITVSGFLMGTTEGDLNWNNVIEVPVSATFNFTGSGDLNWTGGILDGGGTLTNQSIINLIGINSKSIQDNTTVNNLGTINITDTGDLFIQNGSVINNQAAGTIDLQADGGNIMQSGGGLNIINNTGLIMRSSSSGQVDIDAELNNNNGVIQVESGTLIFDSLEKNLTNGTYNVFSGAVLDWESTMELAGVLTGTIDGTLNWNNIVSVPGVATLNFTGTGDVNWTNQALNGGGTLTNLSVLNLTTIGNKFITEDTTLNNTGTININGAGDLFINQGILNNQASGIIDMQADNGNITRSGGTSNILNNSGLLRASTTTGIARIFVELNNSGTIEVETGELEITGSLSFTNEVNGVIKGVGVFDLPIVANYTNDGIFAPGLSPGTLSVQGDYESTTNSILDIELNGLIQGAEYDVLAITGNADFDGSVQITLGFNPDVNDEFIIATTTKTINTCNLPATATSSFGGFNYMFDVLCRNNNELVLTVIDETLSLESFNEEPKSVKLFPNPATDLISFSDDTINRIEVFDINGRKVLSANDYTISVKGLSKGIYIVKGTTANAIVVLKKMIKN
ncbi:T9SS type A sorting domain-containing protein [Ichthyenterobacterium sp. W332]|uniref:T9SS type A sorting domain-containing protein n=1 Tax=Microcosmobacter mediterraneus TaxID=3075607 RepID=A0ABU2YII7_9FLAO|nr:T9SS type A sorting domain-containing protein [Ichthyenterobacterium sp. W332]MDT0557990.1 T9SS type A sorting domain-containing protein [Ichthyenterobacterium sp. W332]